MGHGLHLLPSVAGTLGTVSRQLKAGVQTRIGLNLPDDFGPPGLGTPHDLAGDVRSGPGVYGFVGAAVRAVGHDMLITGNTFRSSHGQPLRHGVGELQVGAGASVRIHRWRVAVVYSQTGVSEQFAGQNGPHRFGSAVFSIARH